MRREIEPRLFDFMPSRFGDRDLKCSSCGMWLTTDRRSRLISIGVLVSVESRLIILARELFPRSVLLAGARERWLLVLLAIAISVAATMSGGLVSRHFARWVLSEDEVQAREKVRARLRGGR